MATRPATIEIAPNAMPAIAIRGLLASPRCTRLRAVSPVITAAIPNGTPISNQHVMSATAPRISETTPNSFRGASGLIASYLTCTDGLVVPPIHCLKIPICHRNLGLEWRAGRQRRAPESAPRRYSSASRGANPLARNVAPAWRVSSRALPEQSVQDQRPLDVVVQFVFGGETDTAQHLLAVTCGRQRRLAGRGLGQQKARLVVVIWPDGGDVQGRLGALDCDERLGQPVPDRLERADVPAELNAVHGMLARQ